MSDLEIKETTQAKPHPQQTATRIVATVFIVLSGFVLYLDKIFTHFNITVENLHGWSDQENYIWSLSQTISPLLIMAGLYLRPYYISLLIPTFCYMLQLYFVLDSTMTVDKPMTWVYVLGSSIIFIVSGWSIKKIIHRIETLRNLKLDVMKDIIEMDTQILQTPDHKHHE